MGVFRQFPYSNFHEMNMDEMIKIIKNMLEEWAQYHAEWDAWMNQMNDDWSNYQEVMNEAWQNMQDFINNYFDNLDVQNEINNKITSMVTTGEFANIVEPYIPPRVAEWLTAHITQPEGVVIDTSLSVAGACADAKATGDAINGINTELNMLARKDNITLTNVNFTTGGGINSLGNVQAISGTTWAYSDFIPIPYEAILFETNAVSLSGSFGLAFYDSYKNFIADSFHANYNAPVIALEDTYRYVRITSYDANSTHNINVTYTSEKDRTSKSIALACDGNYEYSNIAFTTEQGIGTSGGIVAAPSYTTWACSDFLTVPPHSKIMKTNAVSLSATFGIAFYDDTKNYISNSFLAQYVNPTIELLDTYKYVRITSYKADSDHSTVVVNFENNNSLERVGIYDETNVNLADVIQNATVLKGTYTLNSVVELDENRNLIGVDCIVNVSDGGQIRMKSGSSINGIKFVGAWNPTRVQGDGQTYTQYGYVPLISYNDLSDGDTDALFGTGQTYDDAVIYMIANNSQNCRVDGCIFENLDRLAIFAGGRRHQEKDNVVVCNCYFSDCRMGIYVHGEFVRIYANEYLRCIVGCYLIGGNSNNYGEIYKCCDVAYYMPNNAVAHNELTSVEAAHCGLAGLYIKTLLATLGCQITGSHFPDSPIVGETVNNLMFVGCRLDTWFKYDSGQHNSIMCSNIGKSYLYGNTLFDVPNDTLITLNRGLGTVPDTDVNWS